MKSDVIKIDSRGNGFREAIEQTGKTAVFTGLSADESLDLQLLTEEMLSLVRSVTGEVEASFWIESEGKAFELHMTTQTVMDKEKRQQLIESSTSRKNEAATGFLGKLRDKLEEAMMSESDHPENDFPEELLSDLPHGVLGEQDWDGYERSILQTVADQVKMSKLEYISSAGLRVLLRAYGSMKMGGVMRIVNANEITRKVFEVTGFDEYFTIE